MRHRLVVIIWNGEEFTKWMEDNYRNGEDLAGQEWVNEAMECYGLKLKHAATVCNGQVTRYVSEWTDDCEPEIDKTLYREVRLHLLEDAEPEVLIELEIPESDKYP